MFLIQRRLIVAVLIALVFCIFIILHRITLDYVYSLYNNNCRNFTWLSVDKNIKDIELQKMYIEHWKLQRANTNNDRLKAKETLEKLSNLVKNRILKLQNPKECGNAKKLVYTLDTSGYGFELLSATKAFIEAYKLGRMFVLKSKDWRYCRYGWEMVHLPVSDTCNNENGTSYGPWEPNDTDKQVVYLTAEMMKTDKFKKATSLVALPSDIAPWLVTLHENPFLWWTSHFTNYLSRLQPHIKHQMQQHKHMLKGFESPIVGLHIRRGDKAAIQHTLLYPINDYMKHAEKYFMKMENTSRVALKRRVFLATIEPKFETGIKHRYPQYQVVHIKSPSINNDCISLIGIIMDIYFLIESDYVVCTLTSNVCRRVYESKQTTLNAMPDNFYSLDVDHFHSSIEQKYAAFSHVNQTTDELSFDEGDVITVIINPTKHFPRKGFVYGYTSTDMTTGGYIPKNKLVPCIRTAAFPNYDLNLL